MNKLFVAFVGMVLISLLASLATAQEDGTSRSLGDFEPLAPQRLDPGTCGVFLWTPSEPRRLILFASSDQATATVRLAGRTLEFRRNPAGEVITREGIQQNYVHNAERLALSLQLDRGEPAGNVERMSQGVITLLDDEGWERKTPVTGLATCEPVN